MANMTFTSKKRWVSEIPFDNFNQTGRKRESVPDQLENEEHFQNIARKVE